MVVARSVAISSQPLLPVPQAAQPPGPISLHRQSQCCSSVFNPGGFDLSSIAVDPHDATGKTVYVTIMGFSGNAISASISNRSIDAGAHWTDISSNLPNARRTASSSIPTTPIPLCRARHRRLRHYAGHYLYHRQLLERLWHQPAQRPVISLAAAPRYPQAMAAPASFALPPTVAASGRFPCSRPAALLNPQSRSVPRHSLQRPGSCHCQRSPTIR